MAPWAIASRSLVDCLGKSNYGISAHRRFRSPGGSMIRDPGFTLASPSKLAIRATPRRENGPHEA